MAPPTFHPTMFVAALTRQWQQFSLSDAQQMTPHQWWQAVSTALLVCFPPEPPVSGKSSNSRHVNYLSVEFLTGRLTANSLINLSWYDAVTQLLTRYSIQLRDMLAQERDPALGSDGLGRLAACYLDSMATLDKTPPVMD